MRTRWYLGEGGHHVSGRPRIAAGARHPAAGQEYTVTAAARWSGLRRPAVARAAHDTANHALTTAGLPSA